ncbi:PPE domain-containing protein [Nocardia sp. NEAU-G5]|uniref:PPE domain-containing protein n=1 Tax=Nocardia albiluteola TaxID=2842303 RepID=A0ABS6B4Z6_9NOCA|nr:PPE domain-containing protein [Nocardia albiluteola]MBU3065198.1 PPE domain-containing protein [Nocardia albiluteola]
MVEPPQPGFTGTVWEAVPPEQLVQQLTTGPGAAPTAEAGLAYAGLATGLAAAATEYRAILSVLGDAWSSSGSADGLNQLAALSEWLDRMTASTQSNAAIAARQAAAYEIARTALPQLVAVTQAVQAAEDLVRGSLLGAPLAGLLDDAEQKLDAVRRQAARVMQVYESASERLARPWPQDRAPEVSVGAELVAEQAKRTPTTPQPSGGTVGPEQLQGPTPDFLQHIDLSAVQPAPTVPVGTESLIMPGLPLPDAATTLPGPATLQPVAQLVPPATVPAAVAPAAPPSAEPAPLPRGVSADARDVSETIVVNAGFATAPAVLGASTNAAVQLTSESES